MTQLARSLISPIAQGFILPFRAHLEPHDNGALRKASSTSYLCQALLSVISLRQALSRNLGFKVIPAPLKVTYTAPKNRRRTYYGFTQS